MPVTWSLLRPGQEILQTLGFLEDLDTPRSYLDQAPKTDQGNLVPRGAGSKISHCQLF